MYSVFADDVCIYSDVFALDNMKVVNPKLVLEDCAAGSLTMTLPPSNIGYDTIVRMVTDITVKKNGEDYWSGRVLSENKDFWNNRVLTCEGELAFFNDSTQPPKEYIGQTIRGILEGLIAVHNAHVGKNRQFTLGAVTVHDGDTPTFYTNHEKTMASLNSLVETYGGHLRVRHVNGARVLDYLGEYPDTCSQVIQFGVNLVDFTRQWDSTEFATVIVPLGAKLEDSPIEELDAYLTVEEVNGGSRYVQSDEAISSYGWIEKTVSWDEVTDASKLLSYAKEYLADLQFDNMVLELSALDMNYLSVDYEAVKLLDEIRVISRPHGLDRLFPVTKLEIPLDSPEKTQFKLGSTVKTSLTSVNNQINQEILKRIEALPKAHSLLKEAKENATAIMNMATTGYITITKDDYGSDTLYISNVRDYTKADKLWKWNMNGLGYSKDGGVTYGLAMTMDGAIVADYITTGTMSANRIRTGILESTNKNVVFDLDEGTLVMKKGSIRLGDYSDDGEHYQFEVDDDGTMYAGSRATFAGTLSAAGGTFGGLLVAAKGNFKGIVEAEDFISSKTGKSMLNESGQFTGKYLDLYSLTVLNKTTGNTTFAVDSSGNVTINGKVTMGTGSVINWKNVSNSNITSNPAYAKAVEAEATAEDAADDAAAASSKATSAASTARTLSTAVSNLVNGKYKGGSFIDGDTIYSPNLVGAKIYWGENGTYGSLTRGYGNDGKSQTDIVELYSNAGVVLNATTGMRFEGLYLWINMDYTDIHVKYDGRYVTLGKLIENLTKSS